MAETETDTPTGTGIGAGTATGINAAHSASQAGAQQGGQQGDQPSAQHSAQHNEAAADHGGATAVVQLLPRWRRLLGPLGTIAALAAATAFVAAVDPHSPGNYPVCPTQALFGIDCPGCGGLRATHDLTQADIIGAAGHNLLLVLAVPLVIGMLVRAVWLAWHGRIPTQMAATRARLLTIIAVVVVLVFTVVRNIPGVDFLASG